jgi:hypothetical protein
LDKDSLHRRPEFVELKSDPGLTKPVAGPSSINQDDGRNQNHHASTSNDQPAKPEPVAQQPPRRDTPINNRPVQSNAVTNTISNLKNVPQQNNYRPTPNVVNLATNVYRPPPPKNQPTNASSAALKQHQEQPVVNLDVTEPTTTSMDVDYMAGEDDVTFFESEDERWMTGEFDIDLDVDLGRPIDFEADESVTNHDVSGFQEANTCPGSVDPRKRISTVPGPGASASVQRNGTVSISISGLNEDISTSGLGSSTNRNSSNSGGATDLKGNGNNQNDNKEVGFQPVPNVRLSGNGNDRGQQFKGSAGGGNGGRTTPSNTTSSVQPSGSGNGRPSAGGFSFPPGVVRVDSFEISGTKVDNESSCARTSRG